MLTYTYQCRACDHLFDKRQRITDAAEAQCPECESSECERQVQSRPFHLRGGGWYADGYQDDRPK